MAGLKVLMGHTYYRVRGGEDGSFEAERDLLRNKGHEVVEFVRRNEDLALEGGIAQATKTVWNRYAAEALRRTIEVEDPDVVHFQNTFPAMSPAVLRAAKSAGKPVVATIRNFRTTCVNALLYRDGGPCEDCLGSKVPWRGVVHRCYRTRPASSVVAVTNAVHHLAGTWDRCVDRYITLSGFQKSILSQVLPPGKLLIKPNFLHPDPGQGKGDGRFALFVGRISEEKGVGPLVDAWIRRSTDIQLKIVGDGPDLPALLERVGDHSAIDLAGRLPPGDVLHAMGEAPALVVPSMWYEGFPRVIVEAFARGTPVVTYDIGTQGDVVEHGETGLICRLGDADSMVKSCLQLIEDPEMRTRLGGNARAVFEKRYTADTNYRRLLEIYEAAGA